MILPRRGSDCVADSVVLVILVVTTWGTVFAKDTAFVEVVLFESSPTGEYKTYTTGLQGRFSKAGATISAEGEIVQMHPLGLCNNNDEEDLYEYGWVGVVKLEQPALDPSCLTVLGKNRGCKCPCCYFRGEEKMEDLEQQEVFSFFLCGLQRLEKWTPQNNKIKRKRRERKFN